MHGTRACRARTQLACTFRFCKSNVTAHPNSMSKRSLSQSNERMQVVFSASGSTCVCNRLSPFHFSMGLMRACAGGGAVSTAATLMLPPIAARTGSARRAVHCALLLWKAACVVAAPCGVWVSHDAGLMRLTLLHVYLQAALQADIAMYCRQEPDPSACTASS